MVSGKGGGSSFEEQIEATCDYYKVYFGEKFFNKFFMDMWQFITFASELIENGFFDEEDESTWPVNSWSLEDFNISDESTWGPKKQKVESFSASRKRVTSSRNTSNSEYSSLSFEERYRRFFGELYLFAGESSPSNGSGKKLRSVLTDYKVRNSSVPIKQQSDYLFGVLHDFFSGRFNHVSVDKIQSDLTDIASDRDFVKKNGGFIPYFQLMKEIKDRNGGSYVDSNDLVEAIDVLVGNKIFPKPEEIAGAMALNIKPYQLFEDKGHVVSLAEGNGGYLNINDAHSTLEWPIYRVKVVFDYLVKNNVATMVSSILAGDTIYLKGLNGSSSKSKS